MEKCVDLHCHSYCSDGTFSPEGLVLLAKQQGLSALALTDHDTVDGLSAFHDAGKKHDFETISGIEFAAQYAGFHQPEIHIVGLGFDETNTALTEKMQEIQQSRHIRNQKMAEKLTAIGFPISLAEVTQDAGGEIVTRAHFANVLLKKGFVPDRTTVFQRYLSVGCPAYVARTFLTPEICIETIHKAGGVAILAHPTLYHLDTDQILTLCKNLKAMGLDGMECRYATFTKNQTKAMQRIAASLDLLPSGGSDFHGANKPDIQLGKGKGSLFVSYATWEHLKQKCKTP